MKIRTRIFVLVCFVLVSTLICGCSSHSQPSIVGLWEARDVADDYPQAMQVFENGTVVIQIDGRFYAGNYVRDDNAIVLDDEPMTVAVLTRSTVVLTGEDSDDTLVFDRAED